MQYFKLFSVLILAAFLACNPSKRLAKDPEASLKMQIGEMITMLEKGDIVTFIETYAHPEDLEKIVGNETIEQIAENFAGRKAQLLLTSLKGALDDQPEFNEDKTKAVFKPVGMSMALVLERLERKWYIRN